MTPRSQRAAAAGAPLVRTLAQAVAGLAAGALMSLVLLALLPVPQSHQPAPPVAVPDDGGPLQVVVLQYAPEAGDLVLPTYADLLRAFPPEVRVLVAVRDEAAFQDLVDRLRGQGVVRSGLEPVVTGRPITPWSRDRYTLARADQRWLLMVPAASDATGPARLNDWLVPWDLARAMPGTEVVPIPLRFDGGDLLVTDRAVLASYRLVEKNLGGLVPSRQALVERLEEAFGRPVVLFGDGPGQVPYHHVGMYLTPLPDGRMLVGDPDLGLAQLGAERAQALGADTSAATLAQFRTVAQALGEAGYDVVRIPLVPLQGGLDYLTYNNVVMERRDGRTIAYVPTYGIPDLDAAGLAVYRALGVEARPIDVSQIYRQHGSVRCLVNVLRRGEPGAAVLASVGWTSGSASR